MGGREAPAYVLYLITDLKIGGAQKVLVHILKYLDRDRFAPAVACLFGGDLPVGDEIRALGVPVVDIGMSAKWRLDALWRLYLLLRRDQPAILHTSLFHANVIGRIVGRLSGVPTIVTWRQNENIGGPWREMVNRWTAGLDDMVIAVSALARQAEIDRAKVSPNRVQIIPNCVDVAHYAGSDPERAQAIRAAVGIAPDVPLIGFIGRLHQQKGLEDLLMAMGQVQRQIPEARLLLVGDGPLRDVLHARAQALGVSDTVVFAGVRDDVPDLLATFDVFVLPSHWEGLPLALLEAMAARLPVVATRVGGVPEVIVDGETGFIVPPSKPESLAQALIRLLGDPAMRARMGDAGHRRVAQRFGVGHVVEQIEQFYDQLIEAKRKPRGA